ncbi:AAA family ATPase [uncultured Roseobacter sp.]|uniref:ATP-binding protein n=1 Tax=uncultured Roseobacter sp. TaxID=114847 RepID=UPI00261B77CC|nr:AAA family ATPase [uncultured Roseobacter sp.]
MIRIKTLHIEEFRGIRLLDLDLAGQNFGICGPNGTGKSGVVDAIEFCLTGNVTRLSGQGAGELTVKGHAPHVDQRDNPEKALVSLTASIPSLGKDVTITRSVKAPRTVTITPVGGAEEAAITELQSHPEFAISRREIVKYIITPPNQRSKDVQTLLRLDQIEKTRSALLSYANKCKREAEEAERARGRAEGELKTALGVTTLDRDEVLAKANEKRALLGLPALTALTPATSFKDGVAEGDEKAKKVGPSKEVALADLAALAKDAAASPPDPLSQQLEAANTALKALKDDKDALALARQHGFIETGLEFVSGDACPLCDTPWDAEELRAHLKAKLLSAEAVGAQLETIRTAFGVISGALEDRMSAVAKAAAYGAALKEAVPKVAFDEYGQALAAAKQALNAFLDDHALIDDAAAVTGAAWWALPEDVQTRLEEVQTAIGAQPDSSAADVAREFLAVLQDRYERLLSDSMTAKAQKARHAKAQKVHDHYNDVSNKVLETIYDAVANEFTDFYKAINDDEGKFTGELKAEPAKLSFNVDFFGRGTFPPGAYHSEGHQDGMGLCLYLALMKHTLGDKFTFAVLDDVLMSVDTGHRREVCRLLKTQFPNTQFILTTHDRVWLQYMKTEGLIGRSQLFGGWSVELGPRIWDDQDIWTEIQLELDRNDIAKAAWLLRRYLEFISTVLADNLRASVEFRGDAHYDLGDLLPPVLNQWRSRLGKGIKAAAKWGHDKTKEELEEKLATAEALIKATDAERWTINPSVHFNEWQNFTKAEFQAVVDAFKALLDHIRCPNPKCGTFPYLTPRKGSAEDLRCSCQTINVNLKLK